MANPNYVKISPETESKTPNYPLRRALAASGILLASLGVWKGGELAADGFDAAKSHLTASDFERHDCEITGDTATIGADETAWDEAGEPLAQELDIPTDQAMGILAAANPQIESLGRVSAGTVLNVPDCER